ncbi:MAG: tRNA 4-thiouridine(8) synthase ThiI, partial [Treponema sp.]|nr:tRNA 4-thiouridine(8) synthase ThiI [Treponema sp.]
MITWLLKPAELTLKGENRKSFEGALKSNIQRLLSKVDEKIKYKFTAGRYYIQAAEEKSEEIENILSHLIGISGWARTITCEKTPDAVLAACVEEAKKLYNNGIRT